MTKVREAQELTVTQAYALRVDAFLADLAGRVEELAIEGGSIADGDQYEDEELETPVSDEDKERAQDISTELYGLLEVLTSVCIDDSPDVATEQAKYDEYGYPVAQE